MPLLFSLILAMNFFRAVFHKPHYFYWIVACAIFLAFLFRNRTFEFEHVYARFFLEHYLIRHGIAQVSLF